MASTIIVTTAIKIKENDIDSCMLVFDENFVIAAAEASPRLDEKNRKVARSPLPFSKIVLPAEINSGNMAEYPRPAIEIKIKIMYLL